MNVKFFKNVLYGWMSMNHCKAEFAKSWAFSSTFLFIVLLISINNTPGWRRGWTDCHLTEKNEISTHALWSASGAWIHEVLMDSRSAHC
jgi:hypothetical protein